MKTLLVLASVAIGMAAPASAAVSVTYTMQDAFKVGLFVQGNAKVGNSESEGTVVVGGNLEAPSGYSVNLRPGALTPYNVALAVGGGITSNSYGKEQIKVFGSVPQVDVVYGSINPPVTIPATVPDPQYIFNQTYAQPAPPATQLGVSQGTVSVTQAFADLETLSKKIASLSGGGTVSYYNNQDPAANFAAANAYAFKLSDAARIPASTVFGQSFYLFNINASDIISTQNMSQFKQGFIDGAGNQVDLNSFNDLIVFNIVNNLTPSQLANAQTNGFMVNGKYKITGSLADNVLWNISDGALGKLTSDNEFYGSLLAPDSQFVQAGGKTFDGSLIVQSYDGSSGGELHPVLLTPPGGGTVTVFSTVPEPTSALAGVLLALGLFRRQRR